MRRLIVVPLIGLLAAAGCGADDDDGDGGSTDRAGPATSGGGTLTIGDETITLDSARCVLQEQDAAAGGGTIEFVGQGFGTDAAGDEVMLDVSRYSEDSQFAGDGIFVTVGDPFDLESLSLTAPSPLGTVSLEGSTMRADRISFSDDDLNEVAGAFVLNC